MEFQDNKKETDKRQTRAGSYLQDRVFIVVAAAVSNYLSEATWERKGLLWPSLAPLIMVGKSEA